MGRWRRRFIEFSMILRFLEGNFHIMGGHNKGGIGEGEGSSWRVKDWPWLNSAMAEIY